MTEQKPTTRHELEAQIIAKAWQDEAFKQELLSNPKAVFIQQAGLQNIPDSLDIKVVEENPNTLYMVLPMKPVAPAGSELSEDQLEAVAGGIDLGGIAKTIVKTVATGVLGCLGG